MADISSSLSEADSTLSIRNSMRRKNMFRVEYYIVRLVPLTIPAISMKMGSRVRSCDGGVGAFEIELVSIDC